MYHTVVLRFYCDNLISALASVVASVRAVQLSQFVVVCGCRVLRMAEEGRKIVDIKEFEKIREEVAKDETGADWKLAKSFEHTTVYRRTDNDSIFKVSTLIFIITLIPYFAIWPLVFEH